MPTNLWNEKRIARSIDYSRPWYQAARSLLLPILHPGTHVVEVGCGCGEFADLLHRAHGGCTFKYIGLEGSENNVQVVNASFGYSVAVANFESLLPIASNTVDIVVSLEVIEHIANAERFLLEISRALKPNGYLVLSTPNVGFFGHRLRYLAKAEVLQEGVHLRFFNRRKLLAAAASANLYFVKQQSCVPWFGYNTLVRLFNPGLRRHGSLPQLFETTAAMNFVWLLRKSSL